MDYQEFKKGDIVEWCGVRGKVICYEEYNSRYPIHVKFELGGEWCFTEDGRIFPWHEEPSLKLIKRLKQKLTFERIRKECTPMEHLLVDEDGNKRLYLGFNRSGQLVTDLPAGDGAWIFSEDRIESWTIEEYKK